MYQYKCKTLIFQNIYYILLLVYRYEDFSQVAVTVYQKRYMEPQIERNSFEQIYKLLLADCYYF